MSRILLMLVCTFCTLFFNSCNKDNDVDIAQCKVVRLVGNFEDRVKGIATIEYDSKNRISRINSTQDSVLRSFTAVYEKKRVILKTKYDGDFTYDLDGSGRTVRASIYRGDVIYTFSYNSEGHVATVTEKYRTQHETTYTLTYNNGNLSTMTGITPVWNNKRVFVFEYAGDDKHNYDYNLAEPLSFIQLRDIIPGLFGKMSKGRLVKVTEDSDDLNASNVYGQRFITEFKYTFDADRNATNVVITNSSYGKTPGKDLYHNWTTTTNYQLSYKCN